MRAVGKRYTLLLYRKNDLDIVKKQGLIFLVNNINAPQYICSTAEIYSTNHPELKVGDMAIVSYRIAWDKNANAPTERSTNPYYIQTEENGDEIRWCDSENDIFGVIRKGEIYPMKKYVFCELPELVEEKSKGGIIIPEAFRNQKTDKQGYWTTVKAVHLEHNLEAGQKVYAEKDSDILKEVNGEKMLCVPYSKICGYVRSDNYIPMAS